jgi:hypothetical protein
MRAALCILAILFAFTGVSSGQEDKSKRQKEKPIQLPSFDFNGYSGRLTADQSRIWETPDRPANFKPGKARANPTSA